jgi:homoprotocatechuate degradation regulator HpaR
MALRPTARSLPIALLRAREAVMGPIRESLAASGISEQKWRVLRVLEEAGPMDLTRLAAEACLQLPSLTRIAKAMVAEGLVERTADPEDGRRAVLAVTDAGRRLIAAHAPAGAAVFARIEVAFGKERTEALLDLLEALRGSQLGAGGTPDARPAHPSRQRGEGGS